MDELFETRVSELVRKMRDLFVTNVSELCRIRVESLKEQSIF